MSSPLLPTALATQAAERAESAGQALLLWLILAAGLVVFLTALVLLSISRRSQEKRKATEPPQNADAWEASAERLQTPSLPEDD